MKPTMKSSGWAKFWPGVVICCLVAPSLPLGGCAFLPPAPEPEPTPTKVPDPVIVPDAYVPTTETIKGDPLSDNNPTDTSKPEYFVFQRPAEAADLITLRGVFTDASGNELPMTPLARKTWTFKAKLGGIIAPRNGEPGWAQSASASANWIEGRQLQVEQDPKYPLTIDDRKIVQIKITSKKGEAEEVRPFNQLLVRAGWAFVDLSALTSFDFKSWLVDQEYARGLRHRKKGEGVNMQTERYFVAPVGLWALKVRPNHYPPAPGAAPKAPIGGAGSARQKAPVKSKSRTVTIDKNDSPFGQGGTTGASSGGSSQPTLPPPAASGSGSSPGSSANSVQ
jgi:hypothetical protein